jgi:hypothetical protein
VPYVFDTNSFRVLENYYPASFPTFWDNFNEAVAAGMVVSVRGVYNELENLGRTAWLLDWVGQRRASFLTPGAAEMTFVAEIFRVPHFLNLVSTTQRLQGSAVADPFIIACARVLEGCVVTEEALRPNAAKIPNVCQHFGVECTNVEGFLDRMNWKF